MGFISYIQSKNSEPQLMHRWKSSFMNVVVALVLLIIPTQLSHQRSDDMILELGGGRGGVMDDLSRISRYKPQLR